jgi:hypothetical protein
VAEDPGTLLGRLLKKTLLNLYFFISSRHCLFCSNLLSKVSGSWVISFFFLLGIGFRRNNSPSIQDLSVRLSLSLYLSVCLVSVNSRQFFLEVRAYSTF